MNLLVLGSGAREHALVRSLVYDPDVEAVTAAPGNPGMAVLTHCSPGLDPTDADAVVALARQESVDLVVIGPEAPLVAGVADAVRAAGIACFGPSGAAARLEGSKAFAKEVMAAAGVPTAMAHVCSTRDEVLDALDATGAPYVVKDDGLAGGKGVVVTDEHDAALDHATACLDRHGGGGRVVIEDYLDGPEVSIFCLTDGETVLPLAPAQDFKRIGDDDSGPNTGGMGAYSPLPWAVEQVPDLVDVVVRRIAEPTVREMHRRGTPFVGVLYVGLALTSAGPRVVEFNARFGDPEAQVVLARLQTPLGGLLHAAAQGRLAEHPPLRWSDDAAVGVVLAAPGYPTQPRTGTPLCGLERADGQEGVHLLHAGTVIAEHGTDLLSAGGRVLTVVGTGVDLHQARDRAYAAVRLIDLRGGQYRSDIATAAAHDEVRVPTPVQPR